MSFGSVPVIEDVMTQGYCGNDTLSHNAPLKLLKQYGAPVIYIKDWKRLPEIIEFEQQMSLEEVIKRRKNVIQWYKNFRDKMRDRFVNILTKRFFQERR